MLKQPDTYLIYGANSSIGSELAKKVFPDVKNLVLFYHQRKDKIEHLLMDKRVFAFQSDIRNFEEYLKKINEAFSQFDVNELAAVYLPAIRNYDYKPLVDTSLDISREIIDVNFMGTIHFLKGILQIKNSYSKRLVLLGSSVSRIGLKYGSVYSASKAAIANLVRSVAMEEGASNVFINAISPGPVATDNQSFGEDYLKFREKYFEIQKALTSLNKVANSEEVCSLICFLTSLENTHITGEEVFITGGAL